MSTVNLTNKIRISCDTRWQPRSQKADPRYVGDLKPIDTPLGDWAKQSSEKDNSTEYLTMDKLKRLWGFL